ncbi:MAG: N-acetyltransferase family protein [Halolamina sp.]
MSPARTYPDGATGPFPKPPLSFVDGDGRTVAIRPFDGEEATRTALVEMYDDFDPADRAQGIPPNGRDRIEEWLDNILADDCRNVVAWDGDDAVGHATLVPDEDAWELAIFVLQAYQGAGVGTRLLRALLGHAERAGIERVWLTVERWNQPAVALYEKTGFETADAESFELEMAIRLAPDAYGDRDPGPTDVG